MTDATLSFIYSSFFIIYKFMIEQGNTLRENNHYLEIDCGLVIPSNSPKQLVRVKGHNYQLCKDQIKRTQNYSQIQSLELDIYAPSTCPEMSSTLWNQSSGRIHQIDADTQRSQAYHQVLIPTQRHILSSNLEQLAFADYLNAHPTLNSIQLYTQQDSDKDKPQNWTHRLKPQIKITIIRIKEKAKVHLREGQQIEDPQMIREMEETLLEEMNKTKVIIDLRILEVCPKIREWKCARLENDNEEQRDRYAHILITIQDIKFSELLSLCLNKCQIHSIESLSWLDAPLLRLIFLDQNHIVSLRPMIKMLTVNITQISLQNNHISDCSMLHLANWKLLDTIWLQNEGSEECQSNSLTFCVKLKGEGYDWSIFCLCEKRIRQETVGQKLQQKYPGSFEIELFRAEE